MYWPVAVLNVVFFRSGPGVIKLFFMLNSDEHEIFMLINMRMPAIAGILKFISKKCSGSAMFSKINFVIVCN